MYKFEFYSYTNHIWLNKIHERGMESVLPSKQRGRQKPLQTQQRVMILTLWRKEWRWWGDKQVPKDTMIHMGFLTQTCGSENFSKEEYLYWDQDSNENWKGKISEWKEHLCI